MGDLALWFLDATRKCSLTKMASVFSFHSPGLAVHIRMGWVESPKPQDHMEDANSQIQEFDPRYKIECKIGEGSFSEVLKCKDKTTGKLVAAKQLKKSFKSAQHASEVPELIALRKLSSHPNLLHLIESHFDPLTGKLTLVFDLMESSLYDMIKNRKKPLPEARAKNYLYQVIKGLDHIHSHGIFHRDIKPENILVKDDLIKISDLGSVKGIFNGHPYTEYISTRWYRSPECLLTTGYYGPKMDVWAVGCVFYELLTLKPLFPGSSEIDQVARINQVLGTPSSRLLSKFKKHKSRNISNFATKQGTGLNTLVPISVTEAARDVLKQMLIYDPDQRINIRRLNDHRYFQDYKDLESFQKGLTVTSSSASAVDGGSRSNALKNPALLSYLTNERRRKKIVRIKKKKPVAKKENEGPKEKPALASSSSLYHGLVTHQRPVGATRSVAAFQNSGASSSVPAGDAYLKATSHPTLPLSKKLENGPVMRSLRPSGLNPVGEVGTRLYQSNPALAKLKDRLAMRVKPQRSNLLQKRTVK